MVKQLAFGKWILRGLAAGLLLPAALVEAADTNQVPNPSADLENLTL